MTRRMPPLVPRGGRAALVAYLFLGLVATCSFGQIRLEAEHYTAFHDIGGYPVSVVSCSGASGGLAVDYLDRAGEWIELALSLPEETTFADSLRSGQLIGRSAVLRIEFFPAEALEPVARDSVTTLQGRGIG